MTKPVPLASVPSGFEAYADLMNEVLGFVPNSILTMVKRPPLAKAVMTLLGYIAGDESLIDKSLRMFIAYSCSLASGCRYCQAHTSHSAVMMGADQRKVAELWRFDTSDMFTEKERSAIAFAFASGQQPNSVDAGHFVELAKHFSEPEILDIVGIVATFGFLNRWNDSLATELEAIPKLSASENLAAANWVPGKHSA